jgi:signal transduction histidine kinase
VQDQGVGIPADQLPHIFERFYQAPGIEKQIGSSVGLGLGLYIAQKIVEQHGGSIEVDSQPGSGSTFSVILPLVDASKSIQEEAMTSSSSEA